MAAHVVTAKHYRKWGGWVAHCDCGRRTPSVLPTRRKAIQNIRCFAALLTGENK